MWHRFIENLTSLLLWSSVLYILLFLPIGNNYKIVFRNTKRICKITKKSRSSNIIRPIRRINRRQCQNRCNGNKNCNFFWTRRNRNVCYLFKSCNQRRKLRKFRGSLYRKVKSWVETKAKGTINNATILFKNIQNPMPLWFIIITHIPRIYTVNGKWGEWGDYGICNAARGCTKIRRRYCNKPRPSNGGRRCPGKTEQSLRCSPESCGIL